MRHSHQTGSTTGQRSNDAKNKSSDDTSQSTNLSTFAADSTMFMNSPFRFISILAEFWTQRVTRIAKLIPTMHKSTLTPRNILKSLYLLLFLSVASTLCAQVTFLEESTITDEGLYFWYPNGVKAYHYNPNISPWGDHGYKLGEYGAWCKHTNLELDTHVPFMVSAPGFPKGKRSDASVEIVDIFPTLAKLTGGKIPQSCDGQSLEPVLNNPAKEFRPYALSMYPKGSTTGYTMRTDRWRYTEWIQAHTKKIIFRELYDHKDSQLATQNLAKNPEHQDLIAHLSEQLDSPTRIATSKVKYKK